MTLEVDRDQAERVSVAMRLGRLSLAVRSTNTSRQAAEPHGQTDTVWASDVSAALSHDVAVTITTQCAYSRIGRQQGIPLLMCPISMRPNLLRPNMVRPNLLKRAKSRVTHALLEISIAAMVIGTPWGVATAVAQPAAPTAPRAAPGPLRAGCAAGCASRASRTTRRAIDAAGRAIARCAHA